MTVRDIAREWLRRPMVILICGRGEFAPLLGDPFVTIVHVQSRAELDESLRHASIDVAIIEDAPWLAEDAIAVGRLIRARGIGTVFAARTAEAGTRLLRERMTVNLSAVPLGEHLDNAVWIACAETELLRRDVPEWWKKISSGGTPPAFMRFVDDEGRLAPSKSTFMYIFDDAQDAAGAEGESSPLVAPSLPAAELPSDSRSTVMLKPSESLLQTLRRERAPRRWHPSTWVVAAIGAAAALLALMHFLSR